MVIWLTWHKTFIKNYLSQTYFVQSCRHLKSCIMALNSDLIEAFKKAVIILQDMYVGYQKKVMHNMTTKLMN